MNKIFTIYFFLLFSSAFAATASTPSIKELGYSPEEWAHIRTHCGPESPPFLYRPDVSGSLDKAGLEAQYQKVYNSEKRLKNRAYFDDGKKAFFLSWGRIENTIPIAPRFIASVRRHIEEALRLKYVNAIILSDMGHGHFLMPLARYHSKYKKMKVPQVYEQYFADPQTEMLYHTAESLKLTERNAKRELIIKQNPFLGWRYYTRNLKAKNSPTAKIEIKMNMEENYNTVRDIEGYRYGFSFNMSANHQACFPFVHEGKTYYFDLSLHDPGYENPTFWD